jgi:hypothetical protein
MPNQSREPRWGLTALYEVRVSHQVDPRGVLYCRADSVTVPQSGALILSVEVPPIEDLDNEDDEPSSGIESPPALIIAPSQWYSAVQVSPADDGHKPWFFEGGAMDEAADEE